MSVVAERSSALDSNSGVARMWVRIPPWAVVALVSLSKTLNHNCFVLRMGRKAVGPVCCAMHVKEPRTLIVKEKGLAPVFLDSRPEHPTGWICARYKSSVFFIVLLLLRKVRVKLLFPFINTHLDLVFKMSVSSAICIEKEPERIRQIQHLRTNDIPTWPVSSRHVVQTSTL